MLSWRSSTAMVPGQAPSCRCESPPLLPSFWGLKEFYRPPRENGLSRKILYLRPSDIHFPPPSPPLSQIGFRKEQLLMRVAEIREVLSVLKRINDGEGDAVALENRRGKGKDRVQGLGLWKGRLDLQTNVTMGGHSFGGATTVRPAFFFAFHPSGA